MEFPSDVVMENNQEQRIHSKRKWMHFAWRRTHMWLTRDGQWRHSLDLKETTAVNQVGVNEISLKRVSQFVSVLQ